RVIVEISLARKLGRTTANFYRSDAGAIVRIKDRNVLANVVNVFREKCALAFEPLFILEEKRCAPDVWTEDQRFAVIENCRDSIETSSGINNFAAGELVSSPV